MFKTHIKIAIRSLLKQKQYLIINVLGLAIGLTIAMYLLLYVWDELRYDTYHTNAGRIQRVVRTYADSPPTLGTAFPLADLVKENLGAVELATKVLDSRGATITVANEGFFEENLFYVDENFFKVFDFPFAHGNEAVAFDAPYSVLLTEPMALKYFGEAAPIGKTLKLDGQHEFVVTGVLKKVPTYSHFTFDFLFYAQDMNALLDIENLNDNWSQSFFKTYLLVEPSTNIAALEHAITETVQRNSDDRSDYTLQALTDVHLHSDVKGELAVNSDIQLVYLLSGLALAILFLACVNYMNLTTALFSKRVREVGVRKVIGAKRQQLIGQFLTESLLISFVAFAGTVCILELGMPVFQSFTAKNLQLGFEQKLILTGLVFGISMLAGLLSGIYPALFASQFKPLHLMQDLKANSGRTPIWKFLVVGQFAVAIVLIANTIIVSQQLHFLQNKQLGYDKDWLVYVPVRDAGLQDRPDFVKAQFSQNTAVKSIAVSGTTPTVGAPATTLPASEQTGGQALRVNLYFIDENYIPTLNLELAAGRNYDQHIASDSLENIIINERMAAQMGWQTAEKAVGNTIHYWGTDWNVIGVVKDFHYETLRNTISPLVLMPDFLSCRGLVIRINESDVRGSLAAIENTWKEIAPNAPFTYHFMDEELAKAYKAEQQFSQIMVMAAVMAIYIACLGLFGLAAFAAERRTKEIGIRRILGASPGGILVLLSRAFLKLVLIAFIIAAPLSWYGAQFWLENFAYRINVDWWVFPLAGMLTISIALLTVSFQTLRAARTNPVESLRVE